MRDQVKIARVVASGFKVPALDVRLRERTLLWGPNGTGKTAVLDAIRVAILGYVPALGKRLQDVAALIRGRSASVTLHLSDGRTLSWQFDRSARGALTSRTLCSWLPDGATQMEHRAAALELVADDETTVAEVLDARALLRATPAQRTARIQGLLAAGTMTPEERVAVGLDFAARRLADAVGRDVPTAACVELIPGTKEAGSHHGQRRVFDAELDAFRARLREDTATAIEWARIEKNEAAKKVRERKAAAEELKARLDALPAVFSAEIDVMRQKRDALQRQQAIAEHDAAERERQRAARAKATAELEAYRDEVAARDAALEIAEERARNIPQLQAEREEIASLLAAGIDVGQAPVPDTAEIDARIVAAQAEVDRLHAEAARLDEAVGLPPSRFDRDQAANAVSVTAKDLEAAIGNPWQTVFAEARGIAEDVRRVVQTEAVAGPIVARCMALEALANERGAASVDALDVSHRQALDQFQRVALQYQSDAEAYTARRKAADEAKAARSSATVELVAIKAERGMICDKATAAHRAAVEQHKVRLAEARAQDKRLAEQIEQLRSEAFAAAQRKAESCNRVAVAESVLSGLVEAAGRLEAAGDAPDYAAAIAQLDAAILRDEGILAERAGLEHLGVELLDVSTRRDVLAAFEWAAQAVQSAEVERASGAFAGPLAAYVGRPVYIEAGKQACEIGWVDEAGNRVAVEALSGGQFARFLAALQATIADLRGGALQLVIAELGEADDPTVATTAGNLESFDGQVIGARWTPAAGIPKSWTHWCFGAEQQKEEAAA